MALVPCSLYGVRRTLYEIRREKMLKVILLTLFLIYQKQNEYVPSVEEYVSPPDLREPVHATWYINPNNNHTANGGNTFIGSCASNREHLGDVAALYSSDGWFYGYLDCNDVGGTEGIKNGTVIDIYAEDIDQIHRTAEEWGTEFYIVWIDSEG
jgi:hypothetical protein